MPKFIVTVREVHTQDYIVESENEADAKVDVANGNGDLVDDTLSYSHMDEDIGKWDVKLVEE